MIEISLPGPPHARIAQWEFDAARRLEASTHAVRMLGRLAVPQFRAEVARLLTAVTHGRDYVFPAAGPDPALDELAERLERLADVALATRAPRASWYAARARELALEARIGAHCSSAAAVALFQARYPGPSAATLATAQAWLAAAANAAPSDDREMGAECTSAGPEPSSLRAQLEAAVTPLGYRVEVRSDLLAYAATGDRIVYVAANAQLSARAVERTVLHEVHGHVLPHLRAQSAHVPLLRAGSAGARDAQEGLAIWLENSAGLLDSARRSTLAARTLACAAMGAGADLTQTVAQLASAGIDATTAAETTLRTFRGAPARGRGLGREYIYLEQFMQVSAQPAAVRSRLQSAQLSLALAADNAPALLMDAAF